MILIMVSYSKFLVSQKEGDFYGWFLGCIIFWKVTFLLSAGLALWNGINTVRTHPKSFEPQ